MDWFTKFYAWACERLYYEFAWSYDWVSWLISLGYWSSWRRVALDYVTSAGASTPTVLELGFGTGELLREMAQQGIQVYGLELSPAMHKIAAAKLQKQQLVVPCVRAEAQAMPFTAHCFDVLVSTFPAPYILNQATLHECVRLLRKPDPALGLPGGRLVIVGLWVELEQRWLRLLLPLFYGAPSSAFIAHCEARLRAAGLQPSFTAQRIGPMRVSVVVAERQGA